MEHPSLAKEVLEPLYVDEGLSLSAIALRLGPPISKRMVQRALQRHGVKLRPARPPAYKQLTMSRELLEKLYVDEGRSLDEIARIVGMNPATVRVRLKSLGIARRKGAWRTPGDRVPLSHDLLYQLRAVEGRPAVEIARQLGYSEVQVRSALIRHGIVDLTQKKLVYRLGAGELWWLHHHLRWPIRQIATRLSGHVDDVTARMDELGIARLTSRRPGRPVPRPFDVPEPDLDLLDAVLAGAQLKPRMRRRSAIDQASAEELRRLHLQERLIHTP